MEQPTERNLTFKLFALELIVIEMLTAIHLLRPDPIADAKKHRENLQKRLAETTLPLDETSSEYVKGGLAAATDKILEEVGGTFLSKSLRHHLMEAMPGHLIGWVVGGAIVALSGVTPDIWLAQLVHSISQYLPRDWSAATAALATRLSLGVLGGAVIAASFLVGRRKAAVDAAAPVGSTLSSQAQTAPATPLALPDKPSIAVLPFQNISGDPEQEYFCDAMVEDITTALSRMKWLFVIARNSAFTCKGKTIDVKQVGRELGVRYVLEGSVRKASNRVRITGQLIDAINGSHIWADRFDGDMSDLARLQDEVTARLARSLDAEIVAIESVRSQQERPNNPDAVDLTLRGKAEVNKPYSLENRREALRFFERALAIDDQSVDALKVIDSAVLQCV